MPVQSVLLTSVCSIKRAALLDVANWGKHFMQPCKFWWRACVRCRVIVSTRCCILIVEAICCLFLTHALRQLINKWRWFSLGLADWFRVMFSIVTLAIALYVIRVIISLPLSEFKPVAAFDITNFLGLMGFTQSFSYCGLYSTLCTIILNDTISHSKLRSFRARDWTQQFESAAQSAFYFQCHE